MLSRRASDAADASPTTIPAIRAVHQFVPNFVRGDAIGNDTRALRALLGGWGFPSEIFAQYIHRDLAREARFYGHYRKVAHSRNVILFHFSIGSEITSFFARLPDRKVLLYHNITPPEYFVGVSARVADRCRRGRQELARLTTVTELALGDSEFNRRELEAMGFRRTGVRPILIDWTAYAHPPVRTLEATYGQGTNLLSVGRVAPNKRIEDLIKTYYFYRRLDPASRLLVVGSAVDMESYLAGCQKLAAELGVLDGVVFTGPVSQAELCTYYRLASVYLSMSEHEGFCVPLLEAMHFGVPIVAYASTAVPWTLGDAGLLVQEKDFPAIAELIHRVVTEPTLRQAVVAGQRERLKAFEPTVIAERLRGHLDALTEVQR
ncbi:MAG: glycosyltransferase [Candidatus Rokubacteria bacterium]|nr:glycosyltransferase [Candidatus Rokubacteria bacterium]